MKTYLRPLGLFLFIVVLVLLSTDATWAQCPMCRMTAESNLANGGTEGRGLNQGILYLLATPYFIVGTVAYLWWKNRKQESEDL